MKEKFKMIGGFACGILFMVAAITIAAFLIEGGVWLSEKLLPLMSVATGWAFTACIFILVPLAVFHRTRGYAGVGLLVASYIFGLMLLMTGLVLTYTLWGFTAVFVGVLLLGVGVVVTAVLATVFNGIWSALLLLIFLVFLTYGTRLMAFYVIERCEGQLPEHDLDFEQVR